MMRGGEKAIGDLCVIAWVIGLLLILLWIHFSNRKIGRITKTPTIVFPGHKFTVNESHEGVRFLCGYTEHNKKKKWNEAELTEKLESLLKMVGYSFVYKDARVIMIKMNGFLYGKECHDFVPEGGAAPGSHFTYQMYGYNRIQATNYVVDGVSYLAGFCIYIQCWRMLKSTYRRDFIHKIMRAARLENGDHLEHVRERSLVGNSPTTDWNVKHCESLRRDVMTTTSNKTVFHKEWNNMLSTMTIHECAGCDGSDQPPAYTSLFME
ncbi:hypothetical protein CAEBREN_07337 [Caenorhabditis brenneri]|uniref:Uncharacterized protein n=1 Tax=Caenorhabditis brenneri TaxID=135651 RepID=G0MJR5_CAEBE|nr:hypothetical protein CAEBREN_07337 [Caenorhabditis brenneri]